MSQDLELIQERLTKMKAIKAQLLTMKKEKRHSTLKEVNTIIARLERWSKSLQNTPAQV